MEHICDSSANLARLESSQRRQVLNCNCPVSILVTPTRQQDDCESRNLGLENRGAGSELSSCEDQLSRNEMRDFGQHGNSMFFKILIE
jgi:hypothetical protein